MELFLIIPNRINFLQMWRFGRSSECKRSITSTLLNVKSLAIQIFFNLITMRLELSLTGRICVVADVFDGVREDLLKEPLDVVAPHPQCLYQSHVHYGVRHLDVDVFHVLAVQHERTNGTLRRKVVHRIVAVCAVLLKIVPTDRHVSLGLKYPLAVSAVPTVNCSEQVPRYLGFFAKVSNTMLYLPKNDWAQTNINEYRSPYSLVIQTHWYQSCSNS